MKISVIVLLLVLIVLVFWLLWPLDRRDAFLDPRVIGGAPIEHQHVPFYVQMLYKPKGTKKWMNHCGGALISDRHVLTAAHCVVSMEKIRELGNVFAIGVMENGRRRAIRISGVVSHPQYSHGGPYPDFSLNDCAIIKLRRSVQNAAVINLATHLPNPDEQLIVMGRGRFNHQGGLPKRIHYAWLRVDHVWNGMVVRALTRGASGCPGDSGGPLYNPYTNTIFGVVSGGPHGCQKLPDDMYEGQYTAVAPKTEWIRNTMLTMS